MTSNASWFCFMNSKPSPTWRVSLGLKNPLAIPGRYFFDTLMTSQTADSMKTDEQALHSGVLLGTVISIALQRAARILVSHTSSISHRTTDSTSGFFTTSLSTPPSPPPIISTYKKENMLAVETGKITHLEGVALQQIHDLSNTKCE